MKGKVVLITGASSGIGRETAYRFAREGARLVITYCKGKTRGEAAAKKCEKLGAAEVMLIHMDVTDNLSIVRAARKVKRKVGYVDVLVNNAAVAKWAPMMEQTLRDIERQARTNLEGPIKVLHLFLPMVNKTVINIASIAGKQAYAEMSTYCGTKFGLRGFTQALAQEHPSLRVCVVNPDLTATHMTGYEGRSPEEVAETVYRAASGQVDCSGGGDVDVPDVMG